MKTPAPKRYESNAALNRALCAVAENGAREDVAVREVAYASVTELAMPGGVTSGAKRPVTREVGGKTQYLAIVGEANVPGANGRIYSRELWDQQIAGFKPYLAEGLLGGAVDHIGEHAGGNLKDTCILWRELTREADGDRIYGWYEIIEKHTEGANLKAQKEAGLAVGHSTFGYGYGRAAVDEDREKYRLPEGADLTYDPEQGPHFVVMQRWSLRKIDAVDDPSFVNARDQRESAAEGRLLTAGEMRVQIAAAETVRRKALTEGAGRRGSDAPEPDEKQYHASGNGDVFRPTGAGSLKPTLDSHAYRVVSTMSGPMFVKMRPETDELFRFKDSTATKVLAEVNKFWQAETKADYAKFGVLYNRGILLEGPPGTGKTATLHQAAEDVVTAGDVVFYVKSVYTLMEGLQAFRAVEPERRVVVALEDADEYLGYQERAFLQLLDGEESVSGVLYLATTNYKERFPPRLLRPGRFDTIVRVPPPPKEGRLAYLAQKLTGTETPEEIERLAAATDGLSFAHLKELITAVYVMKQPVEQALAKLMGNRVRRTESADVDRIVWAESAGERVVWAGARGTRAPSSTSKATNEGVGTAGDTEQPNMKTLAELEAQFPEVFALHVAAVEGAKAEAQAKLDEATAKLAEAVRIQGVLTDAVNHVLPALKELPEVALPVRMVLEAEAAERIIGLKEQVLTLTSEKAAAEAIKTTAVAEAQALKDARDAAARIAACEAKAAELTKDSAYAALLLAEVTRAATADAKFVADGVEAFVNAKTESFDAIANALNRKPAAEAAKGKDGAAAEGVDEVFGAIGDGAVDDDDLDADEAAAREDAGGGEDDDDKAPEGTAGDGVWG